MSQKTIAFWAMGTEEISDQGSKMPVSLVVVVYLFYLIIMIIFFFWGGGRGGFFVLFLLLLLWHNTQTPKYYEQATKIGHISKQFP